MMGRLQEMKQKADAVKEKLDATEMDVTSAGGDIRITITGTRRIRSLQIAPSLQHGDKEELEEQLMVAFNRAIETADKTNEEEMKRVAGGLLPGLGI